MTCTTGRHACAWSAFDSRTGAIPAAGAAGTSHEETSKSFGISKTLVHRIPRAHTPPAGDSSRGWATPDPHTCAFAGTETPIDDVLDEYARGTALHQLADCFPYPARMPAKLIGDHTAAGPTGSCGCHTCLRSGQAIVVHRVLHTYSSGKNLRWIAERYPYARDTITRIVDADGFARRSASEQSIRFPIDLSRLDRYRDRRPQPERASA